MNSYSSRKEALQAAFAFLNKYKHLHEKELKAGKLRNIGEPSQTSKGGLNRAWSSFVHNARRKKKNVHIHRERWEELVAQTACFFCNRQPSVENLNGLDRINNQNREYTDENCVSCCNYCNLAKGKVTLGAFFGHIRLILLNNGYATIQAPLCLHPQLLSQFWNPSTKDLARIAAHTGALRNFQDQKKLFEQFQSVNSGATERLQINFEQWLHIVAKNCHYCNRPSSEVNMGMDRVDPTIGVYTLSNIVPCCGPCNHVKKNYLWDEVLASLVRIALNQCFVLTKKE